MNKIEKLGEEIGKMLGNPIFWFSIIIPIIFPIYLIYIIYEVFIKEE